MTFSFLIIEEPLGITDLSAILTDTSIIVLLFDHVTFYLTSRDFTERSNCIRAL